MKLIELDGVTKYYRSSWTYKKSPAVRDINLVLNEGEALGFVGANGAGKSTTIKMMVGLLAPSSGVVRLMGKPAKEPSSRVGLGYVPESANLPENLSPRELVEMISNLHGKRNNIDNINYWLKKFDLKSVENKLIRSFSKGMAQRTLLAMAMVIEPRLLILDEPLSGLDPLGRHLVVEILENFRKSGGSIFFTSHVLYDVERVADSFVFIKKGSLQAIKRTNELFKEKELLRIRSFGNVKLNIQRSEGSLFVVDVKRGDLWLTLEEMRSVGQTIIDVESLKGTLEDLFVDFVSN